MQVAESCPECTSIKPVLARIYGNSRIDYRYMAVPDFTPEQRLEGDDNFFDDDLNFRMPVEKRLDKFREVAVPLVTDVCARALKDAGVHASWTGGFGRSSKPSVRIVARRADNDKQVSFDLGMEEDAFRAGDDIQSGGVLKEGRSFSFGPLGMQFIGGKTSLRAAGMREGDKVEGEFEGEVMKLIGMGR